MLKSLIKFLMPGSDKLANMAAESIQKAVNSQT